MKEFLARLLVGILIIACIVVLIQLHHNKMNADRCEKSQYKTREFEISESNKLYCKSANNGYQMLDKNRG
jgi:hypothetical protein